MIKDMLYYRKKINELIEDAYKNGIELVVSEDLEQKSIYIKDTISNEICRLNNTKVKFE